MKPFLTFGHLIIFCKVNICILICISFKITREPPSKILPFLYKIENCEVLLIDSKALLLAVDLFFTLYLADPFPKGQSH